MAIRGRSVVSLREEFCRLADQPGANVSALCRRFGTNRNSGYQWLRRWRSEGAEGLKDRSRRPKSSPGRTAAELEAAVLAVRAEHPTWGGRKIRKVLLVDGWADAPAASTVTEILRRHGRLDGPRAGERRDWVRFEHPEPNDLWQMDFKGHFPLARGRCHPLTVLDDHSRYALEIGACGDEQGLTVQARLTEVFRRYGLPLRILTDNGSPWGTVGSGQPHTQLTVWLLDLGVGVIHGRPYHPQTQGKDERFHGTLKRELLDGRLFADLDQAQAAFDRWRATYNHRRPHEALHLETPSTRYRVSPREMPQVVPPPEYGPDDLVRKVAKGGWITVRGRIINCSKAFTGRWLALRPTSTDGLFDLCYRSHVLAQVDLRQDHPTTVSDVPEHLSALTPV